MAGERSGRKWLATAIAAAVIELAVVLLWPEADARPSLQTDDEVTGVRLAPPLRKRAPGADQQAAIVGYVIDSTGAPAAGAEVEILDRDGLALRSAMTEDDGAFRFEPPPQVGDPVRISGDSLATSTLRWQLGDAVPRILVDRTIAVDVAVSERGAAADGAVVWLRDGSGAPAREAETDSDGHARFSDLAPGIYEVWAERGPMVSRLVTADGLGVGEPSVALSLEVGSALEARLLSPEGEPLVGRVVATPIGFEHARRVFETDETGILRVAALPRGRWRLVASAPNHPAREFTIAATAPTSRIDMRLARGARVSGIVVDDDGEPVSGAALVLHAPSAPPPRTEFVAAPVGLRWVHPLAGKRHLPIRDSRRFGAARDGARPVECGGGHCGVDVGGVRGSVVHAAANGRVVVAARAGMGKAGRFIAVEHESGLKSFYMHLDDIRPDLDIGSEVRAGEAIGTLGSTGVHRSEPHLHFALSRAESGRPIFVDPEPLLHRAVVLPEASALGPVDRGGAWIARPQSAGVDDFVGDAEAESVRSDTDGRFVFEGVAGGAYVAVARKPLLVPGSSDRIVARPGAEIGGVEIRLSTGSSVVGRVLGPRGPVVGARITATEGEGEGALEIARTYSDTSGYYRIERVAGAIELEATAVGFGDASARVNVARTGATLEEDFRLAALSDRLSGVLRDASGFPVRGATVLVADGPSAVGRRASTDEAGNFVLGAVAEGQYTLRAVAIGHPEARVSAQSGSTVEIDLHPGTTVEVLVVDRHTGAAVPGAVLRARGPRGLKMKSTVDERGRVALKGVAGGSWRIAVTPAGYSPASTKLKVSAEGGREEITIEVERGATLAGVVRDRYGERVPGARVSIGAVSTITDQDGRFRIEHAPTGAVTLRSERGGVVGEQEMQLHPGDEFVTLELRLE